MDVSKVSSLVNALLSALREGRDGEAAEVAQAISTLVAGVSAGRFHVYAVEDAADLWEGPLKTLKPAMLVLSDGSAMLYPGKSHSIAAEPTAGKSWVALQVALQMSRSGLSCLYVDFEDDYPSFVRRFRQLGGTVADMRFVSYARFEGGSMVPVLSQMYAHVQEHRPDLVILDGVAQSMQRMGLNELDNSEISRWTSLLVSPVLAAGCATLAMDHLSRASKDMLRGSSAPGGQHQAREARGGTAKIADISGAHYTLVVGSPFAKGVPGHSSLILGKDRAGEVGVRDQTVCVVKYAPHDDAVVEGSLRVAFEPPMSPERLAEILDRKVFDWLDGQGALKAAEVETAGAKALGMSREQLRVVVDRLVQSGAFRTVGEGKRNDPKMVCAVDGRRPQLSPVEKVEPFGPPPF